jgi:hypothetical protein
MSTRPNKFSQSQANRLVKASAKAGVDVHLEFRPDGIIIAPTHKPATSNLLNPFIENLKLGTA